MYEDLDKFLDNPSQLTIRDIVEDYKELIKRTMKISGYTYFIDEESKTCCGLFEYSGSLYPFRLEQEGHRFTKGLRNKIIEVCRQARKDTGLPIEVHTKACFYNDKARKLLRLTKFETIGQKDGYYISIFRG